MHVCPPTHARSHAPQCAGSLATSTQLVPHWVKSAGQVMVQTPLAHTSAAVHATPQPPQCLASVSVLTHSPEQSVSGAEQVQTPATQATPGPHALLQLPQCAVLLSSTTQLSPHSS